MFQISDPSDVVYYVEDRRDSDCPVIDPMMPFSTEDEAVSFAINNMRLSVLDFSIITWKVD